MCVLVAKQLKPQLDQKALRLPRISSRSLNHQLVQVRGHSPLVPYPAPQVDTLFNSFSDPAPDTLFTRQGDAVDA
jgi:hypothetical protein